MHPTLMAAQFDLARTVFPLIPVLLWSDRSEPPKGEEEEEERRNGAAGLASSETVIIRGGLKPLCYSYIRRAPRTTPRPK